jgi:4-hydroxy-3-polyprenylbenzoate decarboxylase
MTLAAVMPLPEGISELIVAGILGQHRIPMADSAAVRRLPSAVCYAEADFCIVGTLHTETKREGPFGDHLGYYSLAHDFPVLKVHRVFHRKDAVFPFTVVGRPPQEDTQFGKFIHHLVGDVVPKKLPGVRAVHAVDEAGVHPLLLALGRESYLPLDPNRRTAELHTLAHSILGYGQLSLVKYLFLAADEDDPNLSVNDVARFLRHILRRTDWRSDAHFVTKTTADTLDYTDGELHRGSKFFTAVSGKPRRQLEEFLPESLPCKNPRLAMPGVLCAEEIDWHGTFPDEIPLIVLVDDSTTAASSLRNFLWTTFTKSDPASDVHGIGEFVENKHWGCTGALVIDARRKPHHPPELVELPEVARKADEITEKILRLTHPRTVGM